MTVSNKQCVGCGKVKPLEEFYKQEAGKYGRTSKCITCVRAWHKEYRDRISPPELRPVRVARELLAKGLKKCNRCGQTKPVEEFRKVRRPQGYVPGCYCKECDKDRCRVWEEKNKERRLDYHRRYSADPVNRPRKLANAKRSRTRTPRRVIQTILIQALKRRPADDPIALDELMAMWDANEGRCALSGIKMTWGQGRVLATSISLDRIDPDIGYAKGNVRLVCHSVNAFRGRMTDAEMLEMARAIVAHADSCRHEPFTFVA